MSSDPPRDQCLGPITADEDSEYKGHDPGKVLENDYLLDGGRESVVREEVPLRELQPQERILLPLG